MVHYKRPSLIKNNFKDKFLINASIRTMNIQLENAENSLSKIKKTFQILVKGKYKKQRKFFAKCLLNVERSNNTRILA